MGVASQPGFKLFANSPGEPSVGLRIIGTYENEVSRHSQMIKPVIH